MATIESKKLVDEIIADNGYMDNKSQAMLIVEYNHSVNDKTMWSIILVPSDLESLMVSPYVRDPRIIWMRENTTVIVRHMS